MFSVRIFACLAMATLLAMPAMPQASTATVSGTVKDSSGAVVPGASVLLLHTGTNVSLRTSTNEVGYFIYPGVIPGPYRLEVEVPGMQKYQAAVTVQVQQRTVLDPVLEPGQTQTSIEVQDITPMVTTDNPTLGRVLERTRIEQLPINGRDFQQLLITVPGMEGARAYGERVGSAEMALDGSALTDRTRGGAQYRPPGLDTIQGFKVETNNSSAKFTRPTTIILTTKSGTNELHGTLFETHRNNAIGKARSRTDSSEKAPPLIRNEFGGTVGGPVYLPGYDGRNRTFFFTSFEAQRYYRKSTAGYAVPTDAMRNGDFSELKNSAARLYTLYDPWTTNPATFQRQPFAHQGGANVIDPAKMSPMWKYLMSITPRATLPDVNPLVADNWWGPSVNNIRNWTTSTRIDHRFSERDSFYARYTQGDFMQDQDTYVPVTDGGANSTLTTAPNKTLALSWIRTFSPTLFGELLVSASRENYLIGQRERNVNFADLLNLPNPFGSNAFPVLNTLSFGDLRYQPINTNGSANTYYMVDNNWTKIHGRHEFQFGFHTRWDYVNILPDQQATAGSVVPIANYTALWDPKGTLASPLTTSMTGHTISSLFLGATRHQVRLNHGMFYGRTKEYALYFQNNWRVTDRLTLNLGLRWEAWPPYKEKYDNLVSFDPAQKAVVLTNPLDHYYRIGSIFPGVVNRMQELGMKFITHEQAGMPKSLQHGNFKDFGPRVGFAYRMGDGARQVVFRGGYRISYYPIPMRPWSEYARSSSPFTAFLHYNPDDTELSPDGERAWSLRNAPAVIAGLNSRDVIDPNKDARSITRGLAANFFDQNMPDTRVQDWNFTIEKEVAPNTVFKASYIGKHTDNLEMFEDLNPATPNYVWLARTGTPVPGGEFGAVATRPFDQTVYGAVQKYGKWGWSNYSGAQFELERRFHKGFGAQLFYVVGNGMSAGGDGYNQFVRPTSYYLPGEVPEKFDDRVRHLWYARDASIPKHRVRWNWIADLPFGRGKKFGGNAGGVLDRVIGGWQIAGSGYLRSTYAELPADVYPTGAAVEQYGYQYPIEDCRSGRCYPGYLWWNGYIPAHQINSYDAGGKPNGVMGVPDNYRPAAQPLIPYPQVQDRNDPLFPFYGTNTVWLPMQDGSTLRTTFSPPTHPWQNQFLPSVRQWNLDASLFKSIPIKERVAMRLNVDFFNVLNKPGNPNSVGGDGILGTRSSGAGPRELQLSLRLLW